MELQESLDILDAYGKTTEMLKLLSLEISLADLSDAIDAYDERDTFKNVITRVFSDTFESEIKQAQAHIDAEQHKEDLFYERMRGAL